MRQRSPMAGAARARRESGCSTTRIFMLPMCVIPTVTNWRPCAAASRSRLKDSGVEKYALGFEYWPIHAHPLHAAALCGSYLDGAARAAAHRASHELLERELAGKRVRTRKLSRGRQHRCRATGIDRHFVKLGGCQCAKPARRELGD